MMHLWSFEAIIKNRKIKIFFIRLFVHEEILLSLVKFVNGTEKQVFFFGCVEKTNKKNMVARWIK